MTTYPALISTVLGSCVSVCLWDPKKKIAGMNHFLYPKLGKGEKPTTKFGNVATPLLIKMMQDEGSLLQNLEAQLYGGAQPVQKNLMCLGGENVAMARNILERYGIGIISEDVKGHLGRKIIFNTYTGEVVVLKVKQLRKTDWIYNYGT